MKGLFFTVALMVALQAFGDGTVVKGHITDKTTGETLIGATVIAQPYASTVTDLDGRYSVTLPAGQHTLTVRYVGYNELKRDITVGREEMTVDIALSPADLQLSQVTVTAQARKDSEVAQTRVQQQSAVVQSGVSAQQIAKTQDKNASEVIRRVPGVSIIDGRYVMVRGLSQRYNNVWLNGGAVPSTEADSRAFSFDILPSSQIAGMTVVKSPAPEYPADFTGGFILIDTKQQHPEGGFNVSVGYGVNDQSTFSRFLHSRGGATDFLGFDNGRRSLSGGIKTSLPCYSGYDNRIDAKASHLINDWTLRSKRPFGDLKFGADYSHEWQAEGGGSAGLLGTVNYGISNRTLNQMENSLYGPYDVLNRKKVYLRKATDDQYTTEVRLGALLNAFWQPKDSRHRFEWKNIFNQTGKDRYTERRGFNAQPDDFHNMEYFYSSRTAYNTQLTGRHNLERQHVDWSLGYAYSNRNLPDRRMIERTDRMEQRMGLYRISREFTRLDEHTASAAANYRRELNLFGTAPTVKAGLYGEYRTRKYRTRQLQYGWQPDNALPEGFLFIEDVQHDLLTDANLGPDKLYLYEEVNFLNNYSAKQSQLSGYVGVNVPLGAWDIYLGARYEYCHQALDLNTRQYEESLHRTTYDYKDIFPSANLVWHLNKFHQLRAAYGRSVNRPEFRELSPSVFYDFELGSDVMGNYDLKAAYIDNFDLRYEFYPRGGEQISVALFYKRFNDPIEWTYTVAGGTDLVYSFINAKGADNYGVELDIRKNLDFVGLKDFSVSFNGSWIKSKVRFPEGTNNINRPMQGQSPYLINAGIFYSGAKCGWSAAALYNRIGKRIVGVGSRYGTSAGGESRNIPNSYEMPHDQIDLSVGKSFGRWQVRLAVRDLLAQNCIFKQFEKIQVEGRSHKVDEVTKRYKPGRDFSVSISCKL